MSSKPKARNNPSLTTIIGVVFLVLALAIVIGVFRYPIIEEVGYTARSLSTPTLLEQPTQPASVDFGIMINKIGANAPVVADIDPFDSRVYQAALTRGVAHAAGTKKPGEGGNIFLFAHSSNDLLTASRFNSVFYLLHHLDHKDLITIWYQGKSYTYEVNHKTIAKPSDLTYLAPTTSEQLTLMTCWPPGTTINRLIIVATPPESY